MITVNSNVMTQGVNMVKGVSFEEVAAVCSKLASENRKISIRTVHSELNGSPSFKTVSDYVERWREQQREMNAHNSIISEHLRNAIVAEIGRNVTAVRAESEEIVKESKEKMAEVMAFLAEAEVKIETLNNELRSSAEEAIATRTQLEKDVVAAKEQIKAAEKRAEECANERDVALRTLEICRTEAAKVQFQIERADAACVEANSRAHDLERKNVELSKLISLAEQRAAVAETRAEERQKQIDVFQVQAKEAKEQISDLEAYLAKLRQEKADSDKRIAVLETRVAEVEKQEKKKAA